MSDPIDRGTAIKKERTMGRIEEWWKKVCIKHNCRYYIHQDYPKCSYCTCPNSCILVNKPKAESRDDTDENSSQKVGT